LVLVPVLAARSRARIPLHSKVTLVEVDAFGLARIYDSHGDRRRVYSTFSFSGRNSLKPMTTSFLVEL
jgi:hypothetical protein